MLTRLKKLLKPVINYGVEKHPDPDIAKNIKISNAAALGHIATTMPYLITFFFIDLSMFTMMFIMVSVFASVPLLNKLGFYSISRHSLLASINLCMLAVCSGVGPEAQIQNFYLFTMNSSLILFQFKEVKNIIIGVLFPIACWYYLEITGYTVIDRMELSEALIHNLKMGLFPTLALLIFGYTFYMFLTYKKSEKKLLVINDELLIAKNEAEKANHAKSNFLAIMSHELRSPMNGVITVAQLLKDTRLESHQKDLLELITNSGEHLLTVINDILDLSKMDSGKFNITPAEFQLQHLVRNSLEILKKQAEQKHLEFDIQYDDSIPEWILGDSTRIRQIIINLISNAIKYTEKGFIRLTIANNGIKEKNLSLRIISEDSGIGIAPKDQANLFKPFTQVENFETRKKEGSGLGLSISKQLIELMNGTIILDSQPGKGSKFTIDLSLPVVEKITEATKNKDALEEIAPNHEEVLIVEDNKLNQKVASKLLTKLGYRSVIAENGQIALDTLKEDPERFLFILMDCQMPVMNGFEATRAIRELEAVGDFPDRHIIIAVTANAIKGDKEKCFDAGMDGFISKPIIISKFKAEITKQLNQKKSDTPN